MVPEEMQQKIIFICFQKKNQAMGPQELSMKNI